MAAGIVALLSAPSAFAGVAVYIDSPPGDWVGQGLEYTFDPPSSSSYTHPTGDRVEVRFDGWTADFAAPFGHRLDVGEYEQAQRWPFQSDVNPGLSLTSPGRGCNQVRGWFRVYEANYASSSVLSFAADFIQICDGQPALFGAIRINSDVPLHQPGPYARALATPGATEGETVRLDGSPSFSRRSGITYSWLQLQGSPVALAGATTATPQFAAPAQAAGSSETLLFRLTVTDAGGLTDSLDVPATVFDVDAPRTRAMLDSTPGDWVGQGLQYFYDAPSSTVKVTSFAGREMTIGITGTEEWDAWLGIGEQQQWQPDTFAGATRTAFRSPARPGIDFYGEGRGCNRTYGWFEIVDWQVVNSSVQAAAIDFLQSCDGQPPLFGAIRINSSVPLERHALYAAAGYDRTVLEGTPIVLDGTQSYSRRGKPFSYSWRQVAGPPAYILSPSASSTEAWVDDVPASGGTLEFELTITDADGSDTDTVAITILSRNQPQTYVRVSSDAGDYVGAGLNWFFVDGVDDITASGSATGAFVVNVKSDDYWTFDFIGPNGAGIQPGAYNNAERYPFQSAGRPGLSYYGGGRGCNTVSGRFDVLSATYLANALQSAAVNFEQHCEGKAPAARGEVRFNVVPDGYPVANAGADREVADGTSVTLDGRGSSAPAGGSIAGYRWRQVGGPAVTLNLRDTATASFTAPVLLDGQRQVLTFALEVTSNRAFRDVDSVTITVVGSHPDTDGDGVPDSADAFPNDPSETKDSDHDGVGDNGDAFPNNPAETRDSDGDGIGDNADAFPNDPAETVDSDHDGVGDNSDAFPNNPAESKDSDHDGVGDNSDAFPNNPAETKDSDHDGVGDNSDAFPNDAAETKDSDHDGIGDNSDAFPNDAAETKDSDHDGVGDNSDAFPNDAAESKDSDHDGIGDNADAFPGDSSENTDTDHDGTGDNADSDADNDGIPDSTESVAPNGGDGNFDGIPDYLEAGVVSLVTASGNSITLTASDASVDSAGGVPNPDPVHTPAGYDLDEGFVGFDLTVPVGGAATVTLRLPGVTPPDTYLKYGPDANGVTRFYEFAFNGVVGAEILGDRVVLHLVDGALGDADGIANGHIVDPGAPAWLHHATPAAGGSSGGASFDGGVLWLLAALASLRSRRSRPGIGGVQ